MPNNKYKRSVKRERELVNEGREQGWICARSAGSKSEVDVWRYNRALKQLEMIQVKTKKGARNILRKPEWIDLGVTVQKFTVSYE